MERVFHFGKVDYLHDGNKTYDTAVEVWYDRRRRRKLSICGEISPVCSGACLDIMAGYIQTPLFKTIHDLWKKYCRPYHWQNCPPDFRQDISEEDERTILALLKGE